jgi:hypothetical protein
MKKIATTFLIGLIALAAAVPALAWVGTVDLGTISVDPLAPYNQTGVRTLDADTLYTIHGLYYVESGATIVIPAGTTLYGVPAATLVVKPGGMIMAEGTLFKPVVFTSSEAPGNRFPGDWGGIVILGKAPVNQPNPLIEGGIIEGSFGGTDVNDNSGVLKYVRIEYPGYRFQLNNEINGLTLGGVGAGTEIHHIQVSYSFDDSYECFGGTVDLHHLVAVGGTDDDFDTDFGYTGHIQFGFGLRDPDYSDPTGQSNGFESDNDGSGSSAWPQTHPIYSNMTMVGPEYVGALPVGNTYENAGVLRKNTRTSIFNSVIAGYPRGISVRDGSRAMAAADTLRFHNNEVTGNYLYSANNIHDTGRWPMVGTWFMNAANQDTTPRSHTAVGLGASISLTDPQPIPQAGSVLIGTADFSDSYLANPSFQTTSYRGAFDPDLPMNRQWTAWWTNFDPQNADYSVAATAVGEAPSRQVALHNYPNPFNPSTVIRFSAPHAGEATVEVFDLGGRKVAEVFKGRLEARDYELNFSGQGLASGTYFYRVNGNGFSATEKMQLVK